MNIPNSKQLQQLQQEIKALAQNLLLPAFGKVSREFKNDQSMLTATDLEMQKQCQQKLHELFPQIAFLGEEMEKEKQQQLLKNSPLLWVLDPIDGTTNFAGGLPFFSVSLALLQNGQPLFGMVYDPFRDECFSAIKNQGAYLNEQKLQLDKKPLPLGHALALIDFKKMPQQYSQPLINTPPYASQRSLGSVALDWCWLAANRCQLYLHCRQGLWDFAAGLLIFNEAGGFHLCLDGTELSFDHLDKQIACAATDKALFQQWKQWLEDC